MDESIEQLIRERAYGLWEKEGCPHGRDLEFWERARLLAAADGAPAPLTPLQQQSMSAEDQALEETFPASDPPSAGRPSGVRVARAS